MFLVKRLGREVRLYNSLQYDHWVLTETDLSVLDYCERPHKITVSVAGKVDYQTSYSREYK